MGDRGLSYVFFSRNELIEVSINAIDTIGKYPENLDHLGLGKAIAQNEIYTFILHMLPKNV